MISVTNGSHHVPTTKSTLSAVNKDEWDTKKGIGKSLSEGIRELISQYRKFH